MSESPTVYQKGHAQYTVDQGHRCDYCGDLANRHCANLSCEKSICALHTANFGAAPLRLEDTYCLACFDEWLEKKQRNLK